MSFVRTLAAAAVAAAFALPAQAANVTLTGWAFGSGPTVNVTGHNGPAGAFVGSLTGAGEHDANPFVTYCIELEEFFSFSKTAMTGYDIVDGHDYFGARRGDATIADRIGRLMTYVGDNPALVSSAAQSASLQIAIWELIYDNDFTVSVAGDFRATSSHRVHADALLVGMQGIAASRYDVLALTKPGKQDFLLLAPSSHTVPAPASLSLAALALAGLAAARRRRA